MTPHGKHYMLLFLWLFVCIVSSQFVQVDEEARAKNFLVWTGIRPINTGTTITDEDLSNLARDAYNEMILQFDALSQPNVPNRLPGWARSKHPTVMAALVDPAGERLYFASSIRSKQAQVKYHMQELGIMARSAGRALQRCQQGIVIETRDNVQHQFKASCGEIMLSVLFFLDRGENADIKGARIVAVGDKDGDVLVKDYCTGQNGVENSYGCSRFLTELDIAFTPAPVNGATRQLGLGQMRQMSLCPAPLIRARL